MITTTTIIDEYRFSIEIDNDRFIDNYRLSFGRSSINTSTSTFEWFRIEKRFQEVIIIKTMFP